MRVKREETDTDEERQNNSLREVNAGERAREEREKEKQKDNKV